VNRRTLLGTLGTLAAAGCLSDVPGVGPPVDADCPALSDGADSLCAHTGDPPLALRPSAWELADGANVSLKFTLENESDRAAEFVGFPSLKRRVDDGWKHLWPLVLPPLEHRVEPGNAYSWEFLFYAEDAAHDADERVDLYELEPGTYAAVVGAELGDRPVQCVAPFEVGNGEGG
jgi:hypothetical protein